MHIVAIHGYPLDRRLWGPLGQLAAAGELGTGVRLFAPDLRGRGTSRHTAAEIHTMSLLADDVAADIDELLPKDEPFVLAGLSMGGYVLFELLRRHGKRFGARLSALALCDTRASADDEMGKTRRYEAIRAIRQRGIQTALEGMLPKLLARASRGMPAEAQTRAMILDTPPATAIADQAGMAERADGFDVLATFDRPVLLVVGDEDALTPPSDAEAMAEVLERAPYVRLLTVPEAGHLAPLERPRELAPALAELVRRAAQAR